MHWTQRWQSLFADPVPLGLLEKLITAGTCLLAIFITAYFSRTIACAPGYPLLVASMGASAVILFAIPNSPLAQPWPFAGGQILSAAIGVVCLQLIPDTVTAAAVATGTAVLLMLMLRCLHPPGAATALAPVLGGEQLARLGFDFVLLPVASNVLLLLAAALVINRGVLRRRYPLLPSLDIPVPNSGQSIITGVHLADDIAEALRKSNNFIDVNNDELYRLFAETEKIAFTRYHGELNCAAIMRTSIMSADYGMEVEDAWALMQSHRLKVLPVLSASRQVIGIMTPHDFLKYVDTLDLRQFAQKLRVFLRRTPDVYADKPEAVGHIMTRRVVTLAADAPIAELIPLMTNNGHRHIPIVDSRQRLVGMVYQSDLLAALYHRSVAESSGAPVA